MTEGYRVLPIAGVEPLMVVNGTLAWRPLRRTLGVRAFGINAYTADDVGQDVVEEHNEEGPGHEEIYVVLSGEARFTVDGDAHDVPAGSLVHIADPTVRRHAVANVPGTTVLAIGAKPGEAFTPSVWEHWFAADAVARGGDVDRAYELTMIGLQEHPGNGFLHYDAACYRALTGRPDEAIQHLRAALEADPDNVRARAISDSDLDSLRNRPDWPI
jgi:Cupin domain